jgi:hypothetical protein
MNNHVQVTFFSDFYAIQCKIAPLMYALQKGISVRHRQTKAHQVITVSIIATSFGFHQIISRQELPNRSQARHLTIEIIIIRELKIAPSSPPSP